MDEAGDRQTVDRLCPLDGVSPGDDGPRLIDLVIAAPQNFLDGMRLHPVCETQEIQGQPGFASHGVYVAEGVGSGYLAEQIGVVHNRGEEVGGLYQGGLPVQHVDACVVALVVAHNQPGVGVGPEALQHLDQRPGPHLGSAAGAAGQLGQFYFRFHISPQLFSAR